jgi:hypothetical protein
MTGARRHCFSKSQAVKVSLKDAFPFRLGATSYVWPAHTDSLKK